jgi:integrase
MGTVFKKTATKPLPPGAKIIVRKGQRFAEWTDAKRKRRTAPVTTGRDGWDRIVVVAKTYTAKYRDGAGIIRETATGCRDEAAARSILSKLERRAELVRGEVLSAAEDAVIDYQSIPLAEHFSAYLDHKTAKGLNRIRIQNTRNRLARLAADCDLRRLADLTAVALERWLTACKAEGMGAGNRNEYRQELVGFGNWAVKNGRLLSNPFGNVPKADAKADVRRQRRAMSEEELTRLLEVARRRPLLDATTVRRGKRRGEAVAVLREKTRRRLERLGWERALIYKTLVLTGLRRGELASLRVSQVYLDADPPYVVLNPGDEKNREGNSVPLRADLAADLRHWLSDKAKAAQEAAGGAPSVPFDPEGVQAGKRDRRNPGAFSGQSCQELTSIRGLPADTPLFTVPAGLVRILDRDLKAAGIPKVDERGRTVDVHALRHTFGTLLSKSGVAPRTAQAAMRHSTIDLTMNTYTDPKLLDVAGAVEALPELPLFGETGQHGAVAGDLRATGTDDCHPENHVKLGGPSPLNAGRIDDSRFRQFAPGFAPATGKSGPMQSTPDKTASGAGKTRERGSLAVSACGVKENNPLTTPVNGLRGVERRRIELPTSALRTQRSPS